MKRTTGSDGLQPLTKKPCLDRSAVQIGAAQHLMIPHYAAPDDEFQIVVSYRSEIEQQMLRIVQDLRAYFGPNSVVLPTLLSGNSHSHCSPVVLASFPVAQARYLRSLWLPRFTG